MNDGSKAITETAKAVQEVAKTAGKAVDLTEKFGAFISRYTSTSLEHGIGIFEDKLIYMRWKNQVQLMQRSEDLIRNLGFEAPTKLIPLKFAIPLFQAASLEDDIDLQDMWAKLLVNSSIAEKGVDLKRIYIDILERISSLEGKILKEIYTLPYEDSQKHLVYTGNLPKSAEISGDDKQSQPSEAVCLSLINLIQLGCLSLPIRGTYREYFHEVSPTLLGKKFYEACSVDEENP